MNELLERPRQIRKFSPGTFQSDEEVISQFVVRNRELGVVMDVLRGNAGSPSCQHALLVGPRGRGKTMLLARVAAELRVDGDLSEKLLPIRFMEESQEIFNLGDFWLEALFHLARERGVRDPDLARELRDVHAALAAERHGGALEDRARAAVLEIADRLGKRLVLMVENLQALCRDVDDDFGWKLRGVLQSEPQIILLATATSRFRELEDAEHAFFELFRIVRLDPLDTGECRRLWEMVTGDDVGEHKIRPLQILTGGDPRLLIIVGGFAKHRSLSQLMEDLVRLIDDHTEYFRGHLEGIAKTERRVYLALIDLWQPSTTGEVAARARLDVRIVSAMLGRLVERGAVVVEGNGRKRAYVAGQRLYSVYYKLRRERDEAAVVLNLIRFMAVFYTEDELTGMTGRLLSEAVQSPILREGIERAIAEMPRISRIFAPEEWQTLSPASEQDMATGDIGADLWRRAIAHRNLGEHEAEIEAYDKIVLVNEDSDVPARQVLIAGALVSKGITQERRGDTRAAMAAFEAAAARFGDSDVPELQVLVAKALYNKGVAQERLGDAQAAVSAYDAMAARFGDSDVPEVQGPVALAMFNKGVALGRIDDAQAAVSAFDAVAERFGDSDLPEVQVPVAKALVNKGATQGRLGDAQAEMAAYDAVAERFGDSDVPTLQVAVAKALVNKGATQARLGDAQAEMAAYGAVAERFGDSDLPELQVLVAKALFNKGATQGRIGDTQSALAAYDAVAERFGDSDVPELQELVAGALFNKGVARGRLGDAQSALAAYDAVAERFGDSDVPEVQELVAGALFNKGATQGRLGDAHAAVAAYGAVAERFEGSDVLRLQVLVAKALVNGATQVRLGDAHAAVATFDAVVARFGDSDVPELQVQVAKALFNRGATQVRLGDAQAAVAAFEAVVARFGDSHVPELQVQVAKALFNRGATQVRLGDAQAAMAAFDAVVERFGDSDVPERQELVARALSNKGATQVRLGDAQAAMAAFDAVVERFGDSDVPELQMHVARTLCNKADAEIRLGRAEEALSICEEVERRVGVLAGIEKGAVERQGRWIRTRALLLLEKPAEAMDVFRSVYALFCPGEDTMVSEMLESVPNLIAAGASERELVGVLSSESEKTDALMPLVVALRQRAGEVVRAPVEVLEIAADIHREIETKLASGGDASNTPFVPSR